MTVDKLALDISRCLESSGAERGITAKMLADLEPRLESALQAVLAAAGSGKPTCSLDGCPGQMGQTSPAALSQTVMTRSIRGAPGSANSSQDLDRRPSTECPFSLSTSMDSGLTAPAGRLPALYALHLPPPRSLIRHSASTLRALLPVHSTSTLMGFSSMRDEVPEG